MKRLKYCKASQYFRDMVILSTYCNLFNASQDALLLFIIILKDYRIIFTISSDIFLQGWKYCKLSQYFLNIVILFKSYNLFLCIARCFLTFLLIFKGFRIIFTNSSDIILQIRKYGKVSQYFLNIVILSKYYNLIHAQQAALLPL